MLEILEKLMDPSEPDIIETVWDHPDREQNKAETV